MSTKTDHPWMLKERIQKLVKELEVERRRADTAEAVAAELQKRLDRCAERNVTLMEKLAETKP